MINLYPRPYNGALYCGEVISTPFCTTPFFQGDVEAPSFSSEGISNVQHAEMKELAHKNFHQNISLLLEAYQEENVPVLLLNPPTNYPFAPHDSTSSSLTTQEQIQQAIDNSKNSTTISSTIRLYNRALAEQYGAAYLDIDDLFHLNSPDGISANGLFWDELHPSVLGHQWIADSITDWIRCRLSDEATECSPDQVPSP